MRFLKGFLLGLIGFAIIYLLNAFIYVDFNIANWTYEVRDEVAGIGATLHLFITLCYLLYHWLND